MTEKTDGVQYEEGFIISRGLKLFTCKWVPANEDPKALIFMCHGYAMECSITMNSTAVQLVKAGFCVYGIDYEGHGKSEGLPGYVPNLDNVIADCCTHFTNISEREENSGKKRFLMGESLGGAVALRIDMMKPGFFDGAVLVAPMCKIAEEMKPAPIVISILTKLGALIPTWKIIPTKDVVDQAFKRTEIREQIRENKYCYKGRPRLRTGYELLQASLDLEKRLKDVKMPFIVLHGEEDMVTDKAVSVELHDVAASRDKTIKLYPGMWHGLLYGETQDNIEIVFKDIIGWLDARSLSSHQLEIEQKLIHDTIKCDL